MGEDIREKKTGYVALIGRPNVGKSTFLNTLLGEKVSIVSSIPQTTRHKILGIYNDLESQILFFDTPGIHANQKEINAYINNQAISGLQDADVVLYFIDTVREIGEEELYIQDLLQKISTPILQVYTKRDLKSSLELPKDAIGISSITKAGFDHLLSTIKSLLPFGPILYPESYYTSQDIYFQVSEIIREKVILHTVEELPHAVYVQTEHIEETPNICRISAYIYCETQSQKRILIGKGGDKLTQIGKDARLELEQLFENKVFLQLRIKVDPKWRKDEQTLKQMFT